MVFAFCKPGIDKYTGKGLEKTFLYITINKRVFIDGYYLWKLERITQKDSTFYYCTKYVVTMAGTYSIYLLED